MKINPELEMFTGGMLETNAYYLTAPEGKILIDAPEGVLHWLQETGKSVDLLLLTHGHFDHIMDAAAVIEAFQCRVAYHADGTAMLTERDHFRRFGFEVGLEPIQPGELLDETENISLLGEDFRIFLVPGHCPGSLCFLRKSTDELFGGDVLFAGGVGRWDLPAGNQEELFSGIKNKLYPLPDNTIVYPGHGPRTTIGTEKRNNPFVRE